MGVVSPMLAGFPMLAVGQENSHDALSVSIFSKHLQFLDYRETGAMAAELGFDGVDLTVRPKGHVLPGNVKEELPAAIAQIKAGGSVCKMITTAISDATQVEDKALIETAAAEGVQFYRSNWFKYQQDQSMPESITFFQEKVRQLSELNQSHNIVGCYQNHSGTGIGASFWELKMLVEQANPDFFGIQYDIRHAVAEGGNSWPNGLKLLQQHIKTICLKDFRWEKQAGKWKLVNVPIGEGMVNFDQYFKLLKSYGLHPPASLHLEYPLGGAEKGRSELTIDKKVVFEAMKKDLEAVRKLWREA